MPDVLALYCDALDALGHAEGDESPSMPATLASLDTQLGRLVQGLKDADLHDDTTFILTGDHGMRHFTHGFGQDALDALAVAGYHRQFLTAGQATAAGTDLVMVVGVSPTSICWAPGRPRPTWRRSAPSSVPHVTHVYDRAELATLHGGDGLGDLVAEPETGWSFRVGDQAHALR